MTQAWHLAVDLAGTGWHPAAWREKGARPSEIFDAAYWTDLVRVAERASLDLVTFDDGLALQSALPHSHDDRTDRVRGRLDALLVAARVAPRSRKIGLVPTVLTTHTEPFHVSKAVATLDFVSRGRAGVLVRPSAAAHEARLVGRRPEIWSATPGSGTLAYDLHHEAADHVEVQRRLWDSWEDDAEIRDIVRGRFVDRDKLHYVDFAGRWFSVRGPSITPRPPQGQPPVFVSVVDEPSRALAVESADVALVAAGSAEATRRLVTGLRRPGIPLVVLADVWVVLGSSEEQAGDRLGRLEAADAALPRPDVDLFVGTPRRLADALAERAAQGVDGFRLRPAVLPEDLEQIGRVLVPELQRRGQFRTTYGETALSERLGLARPESRYARREVSA